MALKQNLTTIQGVQLPEAYIRIDDQRGRTESIEMKISIYANQQKCQDGLPWVEEKIISFYPSVSNDAPNFIKQGYEYLKSLTEFEGAIDA